MFGGSEWTKMRCSLPLRSGDSVEEVGRQAQIMLCGQRWAADSVQGSHSKVLFIQMRELRVPFVGMRTRLQSGSPSREGHLKLRHGGREERRVPRASGVKWLKH